jgi:hypothetical protein
MADYCENCGEELPPGAEACPECGFAAEGIPAPNDGAGEEMDREENKLEERAPIVLTSSASDTSGEAAFAPEGEAAGEKPGLGKVLGDGVKKLVSSLTAALKEPKKLIPAFVLGGVWLVLGLLKSLGVDAFPIKALSFLTNANAGTNGSLLGAIGGIVGKGVFAGALVSLIGVLTKKDGGEKRALSDSVKAAFGFDMSALWEYLAGAGAALLIYIFIAGGSPRMGFMGGAAASYLAARAALRNGFLNKLVSSAAGKARSASGVKSVISGLAAGFALAALLGLFNNRYALLIPGAVLLIGGAVMLILKAAGVLNKGKEAAAQ